jgi:type I restriction enzyme R subunit
MTARQRPANVSFFAFTATPKAKTIELFGRVGASGLPESFHVYSMQQAIEEGFILDVLRNYTPYQLAYQLAHDGRELDDREVDEARGLKELARWVRLHPHNISQKVAVIIEHFRQKVAHKLAGRAKAMVVTGSRKEAVRYKLALDRYLHERGYTDLAALVAFSGEVYDPESGVRTRSAKPT